MNKHTKTQKTKKHINKENIKEINKNKQVKKYINKHKNRINKQQ